MSIRKRTSKKTKNGYIYEVYFDYKKRGIKDRYSKSGFLTKKEAQDHETEKKKELLETGKVSRISNKTLNDVYDDFMEFGCDGYSFNTIEHTRTYYRQCKEIIGNLPIIDINYTVLQKFFNSRKQKGIESNKCIRKSLYRIFKFALKNEDIKNNPVELIKVIGVEKHMEAPKVLDENTFVKIVSELWNSQLFNQKAYAVAIAIGYYTGTRICETCGLLKSQFDFENDIISIETELVYKGLRKQDYYLTSVLKTEESKDIIPIAKDLKPLLLEWFEINPYETVICDIEGKYINPYRISDSAKKIAKRLNKHFNFHMLRHTYATNIVLKGIDLKTAQELMRHSNINTTISTYTHITDQHKKDAIDKVFNSKSVEKVSKNKFYSKQIN